MSLRTFTATLSIATLLLIGCDTNQFDSPDPAVQPPRTETQPPVTDQEYISPDATLPRPESPRQPEYPVTPPADPPATTQPEVFEPADQPPVTTQPEATDDLQEPDAPPSPAVDEPAVEEVPADTPPAQN